MVRALLFFLLISASLPSFASNGSGGVGAEPNPPKISIFPNPTSNYFSLSSTIGLDKLVVFNLLGKEMCSFSINQATKYDISDLPNGMYLVQAYGSDKKIVSTIRLQKR